MAKILRSDSSVGQAYVQQNLGASYTELWVTTRLRYDGASLDALTAALDEQDVLDVADAGTFTFDRIFVDGSAGPPAVWDTAWSFSAVPIAGDTWYTVEVHRITADVSEIYVNGVLAVTDTNADGTEGQYVSAGQLTGVNALSPSLVYHAYVKVGTTRGAQDLFFDDFSSGDVSAWTSSTGDVTVIDDPFVPPPPTPPLKINVAYGDDALAETPTYTDIASMCNRVSTRRGRQYLTDRTEAGTADIGFNDKDGTLDPTNSAGPFFPMNPNCPAQIQLKNAFTGSYVTIFTGLIQGCPQTIRAQGAALDRGTLPLVDLFSLLARRELPTSVDFADLAVPGTYPAGPPPQSANTTGNITYVKQTLQDRMFAILADVGFPSGLLDIFDFGEYVQPMTYSPGYTSLAALQDTSDAGFPGVSNLFVRKDGVLAYRGRFARGGGPLPVTDYGVNIWKAGDLEAVTMDSDLALIAATDFVIDRDIEKVINTALFTPQGIQDVDIAGQLITDPTSMATYGPRGEGATGQNLITAGATVGPNFDDPLLECQMFGQFYVDNFKDPANRIVQAVFRTRHPDRANAEAHWNLLCNAELGDILRVTVSFPYGDGFTTEDYFIEGISYDIELGADIPNVVMTLDLSPTYSTFPYAWDPNDP